MFNSVFWNFFIAVPVIGGILGLLWLVLWMSRTSEKTKDKTDEQTPVETMGHVWDDDLEEFNNPLPMWWLKMFYISIVFSSIYLLLYPGLGSFPGLLGWTQTKQYEREIDTAETRFGPLYEQYRNQPVEVLVENKAAVNMGHQLFMTYCTSCHGSTAGGGPGFPNLTDKDWLYGGTPDIIQKTITEGRQALMPNAQTNNLSEEEIKNVVEYILQLSGGRPNETLNPTKVENGKAVFSRVCFACHGPDGKGTQGVGAPNLTDNIWLYGGSRKKIEETVRQGRQGKMPTFGKLLGEAKIKLLDTYVYSLSLDKDKKPQ